MNITFNPHVNLRGRMRAVTYLDEDRTIVSKDTGWFDNLITDNGLNLLASDTETAIRTCVVGSGTATPSVSDTQLQALIASVTRPDNSGFPELGQIGINSTDNYAYRIMEYNFAQGAAEGNLSEIGIGLNTTSLFARQLIEDGAGNPTTITVLDIEFLTVFYEVRLYQDITDTAGSVGGYSYTIRPALANTARGTATIYEQGWSMWNSSFTGIMSSTSGFTNNATWASDSAIAVYTSQPSEGSSIRGHSSRTGTTYVAGSFEHSITWVWNIDRANYNIISFKFQHGPGEWQFSVSPAIEKDNTKSLTVTTKITWGRYTP